MAKILTPDYSNLLYEGGYGDIYKCREDPSIAIKLTKLDSPAHSRENKCGETNKKIIHRIGRHPNLMKIYGYHHNGSIYMIYLEHIEGAITLSDFVPNSNPKLDEITNITRQILDGLYYLHSNKITHRDIKLNNIIVFRDKTTDHLRIKIVDFGLAFYGLPCSGIVGTSGFFAPEIITRKFYDSKCDIWSLGCILYYLITHTFPYFKVYDKKEYIRQIHNQTAIKYDGDVWQDVGILHQLCQKMLVYQPEERFSAGECLEVFSSMS